MKRQVATWLVGMSVLAMALTGCGEAVADGVPEIIEGRSLCDECGMIIDDVRTAAARRLPDGTSKEFDDIGGMLVDGYRDHDLSAVSWWVFDYGPSDALLLGSDSFEDSGDLLSPMGWGAESCRG